MKLWLVWIGAVALMLCVLDAKAEFRLRNAFPNLSFGSVTDIQNAHDGSGRLFVAEQNGIIWVCEEDSNATDKRVFLDLRSVVLETGVEAGFLGLVFHPDYTANGYFFVSYIMATPDPRRILCPRETACPYTTIIERYRVSADPDSADPTTGIEVFYNVQNSSTHNGGQLAFGDDGYLYFSMGDNTDRDNAQDRTTLPGSMLRIDIDAVQTGNDYGIPPGNPYVGNTMGYREEIYAYGFRNPWRFSIDPVTGTVFIGDVGQFTYEEIDTLVIGGNYGWPLMEGTKCFAPSTCDTAGLDLQMPYYAYNHTVGVAIIGGYVYRGQSAPDLTGRYICADWFGGIFQLTRQGSNPPIFEEILMETPRITTMGVGESGELYIAGDDGGVHYIEQPLTEPLSPSVPADRIGRVYPNPFNPSTTIPYSVANGGFVEVAVYAPDGTFVIRLVSKQLDTGKYFTEWGGESRSGRRVSSGVYFATLIVDGNVVSSSRMVFLK